MCGAAASEVTITHQMLQFVYPRVFPMRKDAAVMTNEAETVDIWE